MKNLSQSEKKILTLLEQDCRLSANQMAKKTRLSPEGVLKIIKRLKNEKIISRFNTKINYSRMGYKLYPAHIKLSKQNQKIKKEIKKILSNHKTCAWYTFCEGEYDLLLSFKILSEKDKLDMNLLFQELSVYTLEKEIHTALYAFEISKSFTNQKTSNFFQTLDHQLEKTNLSNKDIELLDLLKLNSRETILNLSKKTKLSPKVVTSKIKKFKKTKVISGFKTKINTASLNFQPCVALITLDKYNPTDLQNFIKYCQHKEGINYLVRVMGKYDLELTIDVENINHFYSLMNDIREKFTFIKKITTLISTEVS